MRLPLVPEPLRCEEMPDKKDTQQRVQGAKESLHSAQDKLSDATNTAADKSKSALHKAAHSFGLPVPLQEGEEKWVKVFDYCAQEIDDDGNKFMDEEQFINAVAPREDFIKIGKRQYGLLFRVADKSRRGLVSLEDFVNFQRLLKLPDAEFRVAFELFDVNQDGSLSLEEFTRVFSENLGPRSLPFSFSAPWLKLYMGGDNAIHYNEFTQLVKGLQGERVRQAFQYLDPHQTGFITTHDFARIMKEIAGHKLSDSVLERLPAFTSDGRISYAQLRAVMNVIKEIDLVESIVKYAVNSARDSRIERDDFLDAASHFTRYSAFTPMEADVIFKLSSPKNDPKDRLRLSNFDQLFDPKWEAAEYEEPSKPALIHEIGKSAYHFVLGGVAGGIGAAAVYPIDMVKTRMQNQRTKVVGELLYRNSLDCARKIYINEGFLGFYRGLPPQLLGVAPEKAIKLTVNDLVRSRTTDPETGKIPLTAELLAGAAAGGSQVFFTNPLEIVKIRLQMQGEAAKSTGKKPHTALYIVKQLGLFGLYKGARACLLRDVPFSAIYFTAYNHLKKDYFGEGKNGKVLGYGETLLAASIAGMPSAYLTTPADVVKTRLQTEARKGETHYKGLMDALRKIPAEEGFGALFKGGLARVLRSSPQFGVTLVAYETLQAALPYPFDKKSKMVVRSEEDLTKIRARRALRILLDVHEDFGLTKRKHFT